MVSLPLTQIRTRRNRGLASVAYGSSGNSFLSMGFPTRRNRVPLALRWIRWSALGKSARAERAGIRSCSAVLCEVSFGNYFSEWCTSTPGSTLVSSSVPQTRLLSHPPPSSPAPRRAPRAVHGAEMKKVKPPAASATSTTPGRRLMKLSSLMRDVSFTWPPISRWPSCLPFHIRSSTLNFQLGLPSHFSLGLLLWCLRYRNIPRRIRILDAVIRTARWESGCRQRHHPGHSCRPRHTAPLSTAQG